MDLWEWMKAKASNKGIGAGVLAKSAGTDRFTLKSHCENPKLMRVGELVLIAVAIDEPVETVLKKVQEEIRRKYARQN